MNANCGQNACVAVGKFGSSGSKGTLLNSAAFDAERRLP